MSVTIRDVCHRKLYAEDQEWKCDNRKTSETFLGEGHILMFYSSCIHFRLTPTCMPLGLTRFYHPSFWNEAKYCSTASVLHKHL